MDTFNLRGGSGCPDRVEDRDFVVELTVEEMAAVGGGTSDAEANSEKIKR